MFRGFAERDARVCFEYGPNFKQTYRFIKRNAVKKIGQPAKDSMLIFKERTELYEFVVN